MPRLSTLFAFCLALAFSSLAFLWTPAAAPTTSPAYPTFRAVMLSLQTKMHLVSTGIFKEDFGLIERIGWQIAKHQGPPLAERQRVLRLVASELPRFRASDRQVHASAASMARAAQEGRMDLVLAHYHTLLAGCVSCHSLIRPLLFPPSSRPSSPRP